MTRRGLSLCIAASVLLHAGLLALLRAPANEPLAAPSTIALDIRLRAAPAALEPRELSQPLHARRSANRTHRISRVTRSPAAQQPVESASARPSALRPKEIQTVDLEAAQALAKELGRAEYGLTEEPLFAHRRLDAEHVLARGIAHASAADCRTAYSGLLLLALPMLVVDAFRDGGCRW